MSGANGNSLHCHVLRPGSGWRRLDGAVWEHKTGMRIHLGGMLRFSDGKTIASTSEDNATDYIRICGWNKKRGLMVWALNHLPQNADLTGKQKTEKEIEL